MLLVKPYDSIGSIRLGMSTNELVALLGQPKKIIKNHRQELDYQYVGYSIRVSPDEEKVVEVGVRPEISVELMGIKIFEDPNALEKLVEKDGQPYEFVGFLIFTNLGITVSGFHDKDESQKAITVFQKGRWDHLQSQFKSWVQS
jgi:hypothetical protein